MPQTTFDLASAQRIADVVRAVENPPQLAQPLTFEPWFGTRVPRQVRAATFTGAWAIGSTKVVTFKNVPTATASVQNLSWPITANHVSPENCVVGKDGTSWYLVVPVLQTATAVFVTQTEFSTYCKTTVFEDVVVGLTVNTADITVLSDVTVTASLDTQSCAITVGVTKSTSKFNVVSSVSGTTKKIKVVKDTSSAIFITATVTSSYLRLRVP